ncbi:MAG: hypothetical protein Kow00128_11430 [Deltaproteobacteria bacterium]
MLAASAAVARGDGEGCLFCHRLELVRTLPERAVFLRVWDPPGGVHAKLFCSDCHVDAKHAPHAAPPGPAGCIGSCHGSDETAVESHRRAAFGGLTEAHRSAASPFAPCRFCHAAADPAGDTGRIVTRCSRCHSSQAASLSRRIHNRLPVPKACVGCHPPHREATPGKPPVSCNGAGCHPEVSKRALALAAHEVPGTASGVAGTVGRPALFLLIVLAGWGTGRFLSPRTGRTEGER